MVTETTRRPLPGRGARQRLAWQRRQERQAVNPRQLRVVLASRQDMCCAGARVYWTGLVVPVPRCSRCRKVIAVGGEVFSCPDGCGEDLVPEEGGQRCPRCGVLFTYAALARE